MLNIFLWISLYKSLFQSLMTIRQKSRRCRRSLILNTFLHILLYLLHIDCLLNIKEVSLTRLKHLSETRICTCLHLSTTCLSHHDLNCGDESSQEYL